MEGKSAGVKIPKFVGVWRAADDSDDHYVYAVAL